jgi:hypothetical protein
MDTECGIKYIFTAREDQSSLLLRPIDERTKL